MNPNRMPRLSTAVDRRALGATGNVSWPLPGPIGEACHTDPCARRYSYRNEGGLCAARCDTQPTAKSP